MHETLTDGTVGAGTGEYSTVEFSTVELDIIATKLTSISEEMCITLQRTSRSLYVRETADFACAIANTAGRFVAYPQAIGVSGFVGLDLSETIATISKDFTIEPGDVFIANDPYRTGGLATHLPDIQMIAPYFADGELVGYGWAFIHCSDIGGRVPSSVSPLNSNIFSEGLRIPPTKLVSKGVPVPGVENLILNNTRTPDANKGDFQAMVAALNVGENRTRELVEEHSVDLFRESKKYALEQSAGKAKNIIKTLTDGTYSSVDFLDSDADATFELPVRIKTSVTVDDGHLTIDFRGTDPQVQAAFNIASFGRPHAWITTRVLALLNTLDPLLPLNGGLMDVISVISDAGSIVNAQEPAAVGVRHATASRVNDVLSGALIQAAPEVMPAAGSGVVIPVVVAEEIGTSQKVQVLEPMVGGTGGRFGADGVDGRDSGISNLANNPVETVETEISVRVSGYKLREDSGGAGQWRGGNGLELTFDVLADCSLLARGIERRIFAPWGYAGGRAGLNTELIVNPGRPDELKLGLVDVQRLRKGDTVLLRTAGAGGYGDPFKREPKSVLADVRRGLVSVESARDNYGVAVVDGQLDLAETERLRAAAAIDHEDCGSAAQGLGRTQWDKVFDPETYDAFLTEVYKHPSTQRLQLKQEAVGAALKYLPVEFPEVTVLNQDIEKAAAAFRRHVDELTAVDRP